MPQALEEIEKQFQTEFDYVHEAGNLSTVRANLREPFPLVLVPEPFMELCRKKVLVMQDLTPSTKLADALR